MNPPKYAYIDALRGIAILGVIAVHCGQAVPARSLVVQTMMMAGVRGVQLFYIASAVTLCMSWHSRRREERHPVRNYFVRRLFRIAPLFYLAIIGYLALNGWGARVWAPNGIRPWFLPVTALMFHGWHPETINAVVPGGWSVAIEFTFYIMLPAVLAVVTNSTRSIAFLAFSLAVCVANAALMPRLCMYAFPQMEPYLVNAFTFFNFFSQLPVFAVGIVAYYAIKERTVFGLVVGVLLAVVAGAASTWLQEGAFTAFEVLKHHAVVAAVMGVGVFLLARFGDRATVVVNPATVFFGRISYGLYLVHVAFVQTLGAAVLERFPEREDLTCVVFGLAILAIATTLALAAKHFVEDPGIKIGKRLIGAGEARDPLPAGKL